MQQRKLIWKIVATVTLAVSFASVSFAEPAKVLNRENSAAAVHQPPQGIRGYGTGAELRMQTFVEPSASRRESSRGATVGVRISGASMAGNVNGFALSPDGATAVYLADQETLGRFELYSVAVDGSTLPTKISAGLAFGTGDIGVALFRISPSGTEVVFLADPLLGGGNNDLYSVPIDGSSAPVRMNTATQAPVLGVGIAPNGTSVAFFGKATTAGSGSSELYRATIGSVGSGVQLSDASTSNPAGNVVAADFDAISSTLVYAADSGADDNFQWYSVALTASGPGADVLLSSALGFVSLGVISPDSSTLVYAADENSLGVMDLFSVPLTGGTSTRLSPTMAGLGVTSIRVSVDGTHVAYLADQLTAGVSEAFSARIGVFNSSTRLNSTLGLTQSVDVLTVASDGATVLYEADENQTGTFDLMSAPIDGSAGPTTLHAMTPPASAGSFPVLGTPVIGTRAVYPVIASQVDLYSVPFSGGPALIQVNSALAAGDTGRDVFVPPNATRLMAYGVGPTLGVTTTLYTASIRGDLPVEQVNSLNGAGTVGVAGYEISSNETHIVYSQDQATTGKIELFSRELDSDQDTIGNATDNCPFVDNIAQGAVVFGQSVFAADRTTFTWASPVDARYIRGPLASVASLVVDDSGVLLEASVFTDPASPAVGASFYYLFALDCSGRSYQTILGAEVGRDTAGLP
jgi:Tol biopolymer transport system component